MRTFASGLLAFGLAAALGWSGRGEARAQDGLRGPGPEIGGFHLIAVPQVQQELGMDSGQVAKAKGVAERMTARFQQDMGKMQGLKGEEQMKRAVTLAQPHYEEGMRQLKGFLKPAQVDRFDQILFQHRGPMAMLEPKIAKVLSLNNEQAEKVAALFARTTNEQREAVKAAGNDRQAAQGQIEAIAARATGEARGILSPEQQRTWDRLTGPPFNPAHAGGGGTETAKDAPGR